MMSANLRALPALAALSCACAPVAAAALRAQTPHVPAPHAEVPVTKVMLFSSGVGYFEHAGTVHGNSTTELRFKTSQINDILKSLMLQDQDGGRVGTITYPSQDPLAKTLRSFQVDITQNPSLADLLNQLRGARVTIQQASERLTGTILGVETRRKPVDKGDAVATPVLNLLAGASIRSVELQGISSLTLDDPQLQDELAKALSALVQARDQDKKPVTINFTGVGDRHVRIGYVVETPVWKTSYRLMLDDKTQTASLQGWAIVENQTESDWKDVSLSLVSGRPISFTMDLYQPLYASRPNVVPEMYAGLRPQVYDAGLGAARDRVGMTSGAVGNATPAQARRIGVGPDGRPFASQLQEVVVTGASSSFDNFNNSVESVAAAAKLGELFQYTVSDVTLARQKSAMLPIVTDTLHAERLSIYNASVLRSNPLNGVLLKNTTGKHLLQGPVTVLDKGGYAGDARIDNVPPGQERLLSYGIDLDVVVSEKGHETSNIVSASIDHGMMHVQRKEVASTEYTADNKSTRDKTLLIEYPLHQGWKLVDTQKPFETTQSLYRFKGKALANKATVLAVTEARIDSEAIRLVGLDSNTVLAYYRTGEVPSS
ncbi:MAG TPA: DUF4139 domain-containing protein, partial [Gemmatimonadaceae bacterium]